MFVKITTSWLVHIAKISTWLWIFVYKANSWTVQFFLLSLYFQRALRSSINGRKWEDECFSESQQQKRILRANFVESQFDWWSINTEFSRTTKDKVWRDCGSTKSRCVSISYWLYRYWLGALMHTTDWIQAWECLCIGT